MRTADAVDQRLDNLISTFKQKFNTTPAFAAAAPGRVNLIGEHTDYNDGFVLPMAIDYHTIALASPSDSSTPTITVTSTDMPDCDSFTPSKSLTPGQVQWANYLRGVTKGFTDRDIDIPSLNVLIDSSVPTGSGLSSSAALEVSFATLLEDATNQSIDPVDKALICQMSEHDFAGAPCGLMDQFISTMGRKNHAMLLDCRTRQFQLVPLEDPDITVLITNTCVSHDLSTGEYAARRNQCHQAAQVLGVPTLRDATIDLLNEKQSHLDDLLYRRAKHVITEIDRTHQAVAALKSSDWQTLGRLMHQSHDSLRDDYEVSCAELDLIVELTTADEIAEHVIGSRMTGGGFGGCTISLVKTDALDKVASFIETQYHKQTDIQPQLIMTHPADGAHKLEIS